MDFKPERQEIILAVLNGVLSQDHLSMEELRELARRMDLMEFDRHVNEAYQHNPAQTFSESINSTIH